MSISAAVATLMLAAASAASENPKGKANVPANIAGNVETVGQSGGVTAANIGTVNQVLPTLVRGPLLEKFKASFAEGARLRNKLVYEEHTDAEWLTILGSVEEWAGGTYDWLGRDFGAYAAERFNFRTAPALVHFGDGAPKDEKLRNRWNNAMNAMTGWLQNLDLLMREPSLYQQK